MALRDTRRDADSKRDYTWMAYALDGDPAAIYFRVRPLQALNIGLRTGASLAIRAELAESEPEAYAQTFENLRSGVRQSVHSHGGRLLPGRTRILRAVFGVPISFENDVVRAADTALTLAEQVPGITVVMAHGGLSASGVDVVGPSLHEAENALAGLEPGVYLLPAAAVLWGIWPRSKSGCLGETSSG